MVPRSSVGITLLLAACSLVPLLSAQKNDSLPKIKIYFPSGISIENVWLAYSLFGPNGGRIYIGLQGSSDWPAPSFDPVNGQGHVVEPKSYPDHYYEVITHEDRSRVNHFKALAWTKGCQMMAFDAAIETDDIELPFTCIPLKNITLTGHVKGVDFGGKPSRLTVWYHALQWGYLNVCETLCAISSPGIQILSLAAAEVKSDGSFKIDLPDFAADPIASGDSSAEFELMDYKTNLVSEPEIWKAGLYGLRIAAAYPNDLTFVPFDPKVRPASPAR
jgi:hypothetical protein